MPTVPQYQRQSQTQAAPVMTTNLRVPENPLVQGIQQAAGTAVNMMVEEKRKADVALSQDALLQLNEFGDDQINNPQNGLITKQGKAALGQGDVVMQNMQQKAQDLLGTLPDGEARQQLALQFRQSLQSYQNQARRYEVNQFQQFQESQFSGIKQNVVTQAQGLYGDSDAFVDTVKTGFNAIEQYGAAHGWSDEQVTAEKQKLKEQAADGALSTASSQQYLQFMQQNGEPGDNDGAPRVVAHGNSSDARGVRNNNPGNIEAGSNSWDGQAGSDGRFAKFVTPEHGIRALGKNLLAYQRQGYDTVSEIVNRWAPSSDGNNTQAYIAALCKQLSVNPDDQLNMSDINTLRQLCAGIIKHENGKQPYSDEQLNTGVSAALGLSTLESAKRYSGNAAFDAASPQQQAAYLRQSNELRNQARTQFKAQLVDRVQDASAAYLKGIQFDNPPSQGDFINAFGYREGTQRFNDFENLRVAGQYIGSFRTMPTASIQQYVGDLKNQVGNGEGLAGRAAAYDHVQAAADRIISQRKSDPYQAAVDIGAFKPISNGTPETIAAEVKNRFAAQDQLKAIGITAPLLSKQEAQGITDAVRSTTDVNQAVNLLQQFGRTLPPQALRSVSSAIAPGSPGTAYAALLLGQQDNQYDNRSGIIPYSQFVSYKPTLDKYDVAKTVLAGDQMLNPTKAMKDAGISAVSIPSDEKLKTYFDKEVGNAFSYSAQARQVAWGNFRSAYAALAYQSGDASKTNTASPDSDIAEKAAQYATGGVYKGLNGSDVVMPFGMDKTTFRDRYTAAGREAMTQAGLNPSSLENFKAVNVGNNQYRLVNGSGRWATDPRTNQPVTVRVE